MVWNIWSGETTCGLYNHTLRINEACLEIVSNFDTPIQFYTRNLKCFMCDFSPQRTKIYPGSRETFIIDTNYGFESFFSDGNNTYCQREHYLEDFGYYSMNGTEKGCSDVEVIKQPENLIVNLGVSFGIYFCLSAVFWLTRFIYQRYQVYLSLSHVPLRELEMDLGSAHSREEIYNRRRRQTRVISLDAFRGLCIMLMIFVNYGGGEYSIFKHSPWNGLTIADLVFPWFVWIMGASIVLSFRANLRTSTSRKKIFCHILKRSVLLIGLGLMLNSEKRYENNLRFPGVLQRLGITYFIVASVEVLTAKPQRNEEVESKCCREIWHSLAQCVVAVCFVIAHVAITFSLPVPGCPKGYLGPGGLSEHAKFRNCTGGAAGYIDRLLITENHMYHHGTFAKIFKPNVSYDPEGLLGILTTVCCAILGVQAGQIILFFPNPRVRIKKWLIGAVIFGLVAGKLCEWTENEGTIPVNKNLWSLSYVLATSSLALVILIIFYCLIDFTHVWSGAPFIYPGMNAITLYLGHSILKKNLPWRWVPYTNTHLEVLLMDITATVVWMIISYIMYSYNVFITL